VSARADDDVIDAFRYEAFVGLKMGVQGLFVDCKNQLQSHQVASSSQLREILRTFDFNNTKTLTDDKGGLPVSVPIFIIPG
jgi:hypothetical protein